MSVVAVKMKMMPESPSADWQKIEADIKHLSDKDGAKNPSFVLEPIAFGLKALVLTFAWPEDKELDTFEEALRNIDGISSVEMIDIRRAIG